MNDIFKWDTPSWGPFASVVAGPLQTLINLLWAAGVVFCTYHLLVALAQLASARRDRRGGDAEEAVGRVVWPAVAIVALVAVPAIWKVLATGL